MLSRKRRRLLLLFPPLILAGILAWRLLLKPERDVIPPPEYHDAVLAEALEVQVDIVPGDC